MSTTEIAKKLGSLGGKARAKRLSHTQKKSIAASGGQARAQSLFKANRIAINFEYVRAMKELRPKSIKVKSLKTTAERLPGIYLNDQKQNAKI